MTKILTQISIHMENRPGALAELTPQADAEPLVTRKKARESSQKELEPAAMASSAELESNGDELLADLKSVIRDRFSKLGDN